MTINIKPPVGSARPITNEERSALVLNLGLNDVHPRLTALEGASSPITVVNDMVSSAEDATATGNVLANDSAISGTLTVLQFTVAGISGIFNPGQTATIPGRGTITIASNGAYTFVPVANYNGSVPTITYQVTNGTDIKLGNLVFTVTAVADAPVALDDTPSGPINTPISFAPLSNDTSVDGGSLAVTHINSTPVTAGGSSVSVTHGTIALLASNIIRITPETDYTGTVSFTYRVTDTNGLTATATITATFVNPEAGVSGDYYVSPNGSNANNGLTAATPWKTFAYAFAQGGGGKTYVLMDGAYNDTVTGVMSIPGVTLESGAFYGPNTAQIPAGTSESVRTVIVARNRGRAVIQGGLFIGRSYQKYSFIKVDGVRFNGGAQMYNTSFVTFKNLAVNGTLSVGTIDHDQGNTDNLVEDCWVWASSQRIIAINYRAHRCVWRRVVVRGDGCGTSACAGSGNPNVGFTVYDSHDVSVQNVLVLDRVLAGTDSHYADFAIASHTGGLYTFGRNEWLGTISLNSPDSGYYMEPDNTTSVDPTIKLENVVAWGAIDAGLNLAREQTHTTVKGATISVKGGDAFRAAPELAGMGHTYQNIIVRGIGRYALNSANIVDYACVSGTWSQGAYNQTTPTNVGTDDPLGLSLKHLMRIEAGSPLKGAGYLGSDIGATILKRYGVDGAQYGDTDYNTLSDVDLWPWPNEDLIKSNMSETTSRGFCAPGQRLDGVNPVTLTSYLWEALGYPIPEDIYPLTSSPVLVTAPVITGSFVRGGTLTCGAGSWANLPSSYAYQWLRAGSPIVGAMAASYVPAAPDVSAVVTCRVTASNVVSTSVPSVAVGQTVAEAQAPANMIAVISGIFTVGASLFASPGPLTAQPPATLSYQWKRGGTNVGTDSAEYVPTIAGSHTVTITATNIAGSQIATSTAAGVASAVAPANTVAPAITPTSASEGSTLTCSTGTWTGSPTIAYAYQWKRGATNIGTNSATYVVVSADTGANITCTVTATNGGGSVPQVSNTVVPSAVTTVGDTFVEASPPVSLQSHTATGTGGGFTWGKPGSINSTDLRVITGNVVCPFATVTFQPYVISSMPASAEQDVEADIWFVTAAKTSMMLGARISSDAQSGVWAWQASGSWVIYERVSGSWAPLGNASQDLGGTYKMRLVLRGGVAKLLKDGVEIISGVSTSVTANGRVGVASYYTESEGNTLTNFVAKWS